MDVTHTNTAAGTADSIYQFSHSYFSVSNQECYEFVLPAIPHAIQLLRGETVKTDVTHSKMAAGSTQQVSNSGEF